MNIRQSDSWGNYLKLISWKVKKIGETQVFIRPLPLLPASVIKIQLPKNPLPFTAIDKLAKKEQALFVLIEPETEGFEEKLFIKNGYQKGGMFLTHTATIQIGLKKPEKEIFASFSENARRNIKKAQNNNLSIAVTFLNEPQAQSDFEVFLKLHRELTALKKIGTPPPSEMRKKMAAFSDNSCMLLAYRGEQAIAGIWLGIFNGSFFYMHTGVNKAGYKFLANYLLVWEGVKLGKKLGLTTFDFDGIYDPRFPKVHTGWKNFSDFKKRFHGRLVEYPGPRIKYYSLWFKIFHQCSKIFWI